MQVGKDRVKGYFLAGFHPASILCLTTLSPFIPFHFASCALWPSPTVLPLLRFRTDVCQESDPGQVRPRSAKADQEPQDHLDRPSAFVQRVLTLSRDFLSSSALWPVKTRGINYSRSLCFIFGANHYDPGIGR